jgi:hypothetical protein
MAEKRSQKQRHNWRSVLESYPNHVRAIGMISIENGVLEYNLSHLLARILDVRLDVGEALYLTPKSAFARLQILESAAKARLRPKKAGDRFYENESAKALALARVLRIVGKAKSAIGQRHTIMHDLWGVHVDDSSGASGVARISLPAKEGTPATPAPETHLQALIENMRTLINEIKTFNDELKDRHPALVDMALEPPDKGPPKIPITPKTPTADS